MLALRKKNEDLIMVKHCVDYLALRGKRDDLGLSLSPGDRELLDELERFFLERAEHAPAGVPEWARRDHHRRDLKLAVRFTRADGSASDGRMVNLSGGGAFVETIEPLAAGQRTVLRIIDEAAAREWRLGAAVAWVQHGGGMGLRFVGIPLEVRLGHRPHAKPPLRRAA